MSPISRRQDISQPSLQAFETGAETGKSGVRAKGVGNEATPSPTLLESPPRCSRAHFFPFLDQFLTLSHYVAGHFCKVFY